MIIIPPSRQEGPAARGSTFTGDVFPYVTMPSTDGVVINTVDFTPCARTYWHRHERGQILLVVAGRGLIQAKGGPVRAIRAGDTIWAPPGERHWHGGSPESYLVHIAVSLGRTEWEDEVTDDEYNAEVEDDG
jgi:quercetin dioxygenase-like cupin family protein